ncbi:hypothetical protein LZ686_05850 [Paracoccus sp. NFXS7]|uniref:hypothetical protein n=1 Tax=Paracoccus sp. NFXS7 TaxID=2908653 RepID=UPI0032E03FBA
MQDSVRQKIGSIALTWNQAEVALRDIVNLYVDIDALTFGLIIRPLNTASLEKLLRKLISAKEPERTITAEINASLDRMRICRENRNTILHRIGELSGNLTAESEMLIARSLEEMNAERQFMLALKLNLTVIIFDRAARHVPNDEDESGEDESRPVVAFNPPARPNRPIELDFNLLQTTNVN